MSQTTVERLQILSEKAEERRKQGREELAGRYTEIAKLLSEKAGVSLPDGLEQRICQGCSKYLGPDDTKIRKRNGKLIQRCLKCGEVSRNEL